MIRTRLPKTLQMWMGERGFKWIDKSSPHYLTEDEIYSAALELQYDMNSYGNLWNEETTPTENAVIDNFVEREGKTHKRLDLSEWYEKGC